MIALAIVLAILLALSLAGNAWQWHRWQSYRSRPAGTHSHTGMMQRVTQQDVARNRRKTMGA